MHGKNLNLRLLSWDSLSVFLKCLLVNKISKLYTENNKSIIQISFFSATIYLNHKYFVIEPEENFKRQLLLLQIKI